MNFNLYDWEKAIKYVEKTCDNLGRMGIIVKATPYMNYPDNKGINLKVLDSDGNVFDQYSTGIHESLGEFYQSIDILANRICQENKNVNYSADKEVNSDLMFETIYDISILAGAMISEGKIVVNDSRELRDTIISLAKNFENKYARVSWDDYDKDYMETMEEFAEKNLIELYGKEQEKLFIEMSDVNDVVDFNLLTFNDYGTSEKPYQFFFSYDVPEEQLNKIIKGFGYDEPCEYFELCLNIYGKGDYSVEAIITFEGDFQESIDILEKVTTIDNFIEVIKNSNTEMAKEALEAYEEIHKIENTSLDVILDDAAVKTVKEKSFIDIKYEFDCSCCMEASISVRSDATKEEIELAIFEDIQDRYGAELYWAKDEKEMENRRESRGWR